MDSKKLDELCFEYIKAKKEKEEIQKKIDVLGQLIASATNVDEKGDYEGSINLKGDKFKVRVRYRLNNVVNKTVADNVLHALNRLPDDVFGVTYRFSKTKAKELTTEELKLIQMAIVSKRAKTEIYIEENK